MSELLNSRLFTTLVSRVRYWSFQNDILHPDAQDSDTEQWADLITKAQHTPTLNMNTLHNSETNPIQNRFEDTTECTDNIKYCNLANEMSAIGQGGSKRGGGCRMV